LYKEIDMPCSADGLRRIPETTWGKTGENTRKKYGANVGWEKVGVRRVGREGFST